MPVIATPTNATSTNVDNLRLFMRDYYDKNPLHADVEFVDTELTTALDNAINHANIIDRPTTWTVTTFPNEYVLMLGAASHLTKSESIRQLRNQSQYQDGNIQSVGMDEKHGAYLQLSQVLSQEFTSHIKSMKISDNLGIRGFKSPLARSLIR